MEPPKRIAHKNAVITNLLRANPPKVVPLPVAKTCSVGTQTEMIKINSLDNMTQSRKFTRPKTTLVQQQKWPESKAEPSTPDTDKRTTRNKACQTQKAGLKRTTSEPQMDTLKATMLKRRRMSIDVDRARLKKLLDEINSDPPPSWHKASLLWLDLDVLERRIEEFEQEEVEANGST